MTRVKSYLCRNLFLLFSWEVDEGIVLGAYEEWNGRLVETAALSIPLLYTVEGTLPCEIKHEEDGDSVVAHKRKHVDEFTLTTKIPDGEGDLCVPDRDCLFHEVDTCSSQYKYATAIVQVVRLPLRTRTERLYVVFIPTAFHILDHQAGLADLSVANHANFDDHTGVLSLSLLLLLLAILHSRA